MTTPFPPTSLSPLVWIGLVPNLGKFDGLVERPELTLSTKFDAHNMILGGENMLEHDL